MANADAFESFFRRADVDRDGLISGSEAVGFFQGSGLPQPTLAKIWQFSDENRAGYLSRQEFYNALKLVTVAQTGRDLTPELVKAALNGPAASKIPPPRINSPTPSAANFGQAPRAQAPPASPQGNYGHQFSAPGFSAAGGPGVAQPRSPLGGAASLPSGAYGTQFSAGVDLSGSGPGPGFGYQSAGAPGLPRPAAPHSMLSTAASSPSAMSIPAPGTGGLKVGPGSGDLYRMAIPTRPSGAGPQSNSTPESQAGGGSPRTDPVGAAKPSIVSQTSDSGSGYGVRPPTAPVMTAPWPRMSSNDVQRYTRVFDKVDTDHDGKITGEEARYLFLSWQLPREVLKQVWDLSDQDGDSMLSFREFCTALYLMERFREGRPPPLALPPGIHLDEPPGQGQMSAAQHHVHGGSNWQQQGNMQQVGPGSAPVSGPAPIRPTLLTIPAEQMYLQNMNSSGSTGADAPKDAFGEFNILNKKKQPEREGPSSMPSADALPNPIPGGQDTSANKATADSKLMDHREKSAYYRTKLQEIVLFKSRCDNKLSDISERAAGDKREVDLLAKKYDEKFKAAAEVNAQLAIENANLRDIQEKKLELLDALFKMEHGGDPNALLLKRANHIATDLDKLKIALGDRGRILGVEIKQKLPKEMPFAWTQNLQEKASEWNDWDELEDRDFSVVQDATDEATFTEKPSAAARWGKEEKSLLEIESLPACDSDPDRNSGVEPEIASSTQPAPTATTSQLPGEASIRNGGEVPASDSSAKPSSSVKSGVASSVSTAKASERYANVRESHESGSDLFNGSTAASSPTSSLELGRRFSSTPDMAGGVGLSWGFVSNEDDADLGPRASWGNQSNPPSTEASQLEVPANPKRGATRFRNSTGSIDLGSPRTSSLDGASSSPGRPFEPYRIDHSQDLDSSSAFGSLTASKDSTRMSAFFGGNDSPASSPQAQGFPRFDSLGPPTRPSGAVEDRASNIFNRFESVQSGGARDRGFHSDDEADVFSAADTFSAKQTQAFDGWKAF